MVRATTAIVPTKKVKLLRKGQTTDQLLKELKVEQKKLNDPSSDSLSKAYLDSAREELIKEELLFHKGKEVRASLACCLADLLRLYAPNSPYEVDQLPMIFQFFLSVLTATNGGLNKPTSPVFSDATSLLQTLVDVKSLLLMWEIDGPERLICEYFTGLFAVMKNETPIRIVLLVSNLLIDLLLEGDAVPKKVVELLIAYLHPTVKRTNPVASRLATLVCNGASSSLHGSIGQYFAKEMAKATSKEETPAMEQALQKIYTLIININASAPSVLLSIMPRLEDGLRAENDTIREASVKTLGQMFSEKVAEEGRDGDLAQKYQSTWKAWLSRSVDKSSSIRLLWIEATRGLIIHHPDLRAEVEEHIVQKFIDSDEKIRLSMISVFGTLDFETLCHHVSLSALKELGNRVLDTKEAVRLEALEVIGRAFSLAYPEIERGNEVVIAQFGWIPNKVMSAFLPTVAGSLFVVQYTLLRFILPLPKLGQEDEAKWVDRFLLVLQSLDDENATLMAKISNFVDQRRHLYQFLESCQAFNGGVVDGSQEEIMSTKAKLLRSIEVIATSFSDVSVAARDLNSFAKQNDARSYKLMKVIMDSQSDLKTFVKAMTEMKKKLQSGGGGKANATMTVVVRLASFPFIQTSSIPILLRKVQKMDAVESSKTIKKRVIDLLKAVAKSQPTMFLDHVPQLLEIVCDERKNGDVKAICLMAMARVEGSEAGKGLITLDKTSMKKIRSMTIEGSQLEAKYAANLLALLSSHSDSSSATQMVEEVCEEMAHDLAAYDDAKLVAVMATLKQFVKRASPILRHVSASMAQKVVQHVLLKPLSEENKRKTEESEEELDDWVEDEDMNDEVRARVLAIQFLTQQCVAYAEQDGVNSMIKPSLKLLFTCLEHGQPGKALQSNATTRGRFRIVAAISLLKLARNASCESHIGVHDFQTFATTVQDPTFQVRDRFLQKLLHYQIQRSSNLPARYYILGFMTAYDPVEENPTMVQSICTRLQSIMTQELRLKYFDLGLARLIHLINHYPDFKDGKLNDLDSLQNASQYLDFYLDCCANQSNLACLYYIANRCKGFEDQDQEASEGIYRLSELAMCLIKKRADVLGCSVGNWAGRVDLPKELYKPMSSREDQNEIYKRGFLSDEIIEHFQNMPVKRTAHGGSAKRKAAAASAASKREDKKKKKKSNNMKAKTAGVTANSTKKGSKRARKNKKGQDDDEDEESELSDESIEEDYDEDVNMSEQESIQNSNGQAEEEKEEDISEDEEVESGGEEGAEGKGRGARLKNKVRKEKLARNEQRQRRRQAAAHV
ncbi:hypothetical protein CBS101457_006183 [Exobasidium rhododendri]|nr:hypothetical protein CBS101457_006183 [Exobasidium rhododendri]